MKFALTKNIHNQKTEWVLRFDHFDVAATRKEVLGRAVEELNRLLEEVGALRSESSGL